MFKWPLLAMMLLACSEGDVQAPMLGDCSSCGAPPISGGGNSGNGTSDASFGDAANFDASTDAIATVDVGANPDAANTPDGSDISDVGVPSSLDAQLNP